MNLARTTLRAVFCMALLGSTIACGSSATPNAWGALLADSGGYGSQDGTVSGDDGGGGTSSGGSGGGSSSGGSSGGGNGCPSSCTSNADCQNACPSVMGGGINCCDLTSGTCFSNMKSTCPAQQDAAAE